MGRENFRSVSTSSVFGVWCNLPNQPPWKWCQGFAWEPRALDANWLLRDKISKKILRPASNKSVFSIKEILMFFENPQIFLHSEKKSPTFFHLPKKKRVSKTELPTTSLVRLHALGRRLEVPDKPSVDWMNWTWVSNLIIFQSMEKWHLFDCYPPGN